MSDLTVSVAFIVFCTSDVIVPQINKNTNNNINAGQMG